MQINEAWKTNIAQDTIIDLDNTELVKLAKEMQEKHQLKNNAYFFNRKKYNCFIEYKDNPHIRKLAISSIEKIREYMRLIYDESVPFEVEIQGWAMVQKRGHWVVPHHHTGHHLSAIYYVDVPDIVDSPINYSGALVLNAPNAMPRSWVVRSQKNAENNLLHIQVKQNDIVIFPSYVIHSVSPWYGMKDRVCYAMNFFIKRELDMEPMISEREFIDVDK